jgi:hypothetical protein
LDRWHVAIVSDKTTAAGWVVEVVTLPRGGGAPIFKYFNVAIGDAMKAVEAVRERRDASDANRVQTVRELSGRELTTLRLRAGAVRPA